MEPMICGRHKHAVTLRGRVHGNRPTSVGKGLMGLAGVSVWFEPARRGQASERGCLRRCRPSAPSSGGRWQSPCGSDPGSSGTGEGSGGRRACGMTTTALNDSDHTLTTKHPCLSSLRDTPPARPHLQPGSQLATHMPLNCRLYASVWWCDAR